MSELQEILVQYIPYIAAIITFVGTAFKILHDLKGFRDDSNIASIKAQLNALKDQFDSLCTQLRETNKLNRRLLKEITKLADFEEEVEEGE